MLTSRKTLGLCVAMIAGVFQNKIRVSNARSCSGG
jgi:hypothetical protein